MPPAVEPATLRFKEGTPYSEAFGDVYHSAHGGPEQARFVFLDGNQIPRRWAGRDRFVILETGFGFGLNFLATWQAFRGQPGKLHYVAIEKHPYSLQDLRTLHARYEEFGELAAKLHAHWPPLVPGGHRAELEPNVVLTLFFADVAVARDLRLKADAFYLDGFSPAKNPDMWTPQLMRALSRLAAPGATAATWSVAGPVRHALEATGWEVEKRQGFGNKREMLVARHPRAREEPVRPQRKATVVGAGLAGAAVCERLAARGWEVTLRERHPEPAAEASGNHAGAFHPVATPDDSLFARLTRGGFLYSLRNWASLKDVRWDACGALQLARDEKEEASQERAAAGQPPDYVQYVDRDKASRHAGVPVAAGGLWFPQGGWIQPRSLVDAQIGKAIKKFGSEVKSVDPDSITILANSSEAPALHPVPHLRLRRVRGQLTYVPEGRIEPPHAVVLRGGMVLPPVEGLCVVGATFDLEDEDSSLRAESHESNLERLRQILSQDAKIENPDGRVAFRAVLPDRLPAVGKLAENLYAAFAYGSRGLIWAALAAEILASELEGEPLPVEGKLADALDPLRFARRMIRRQGGKA
ncbi:MAG TPA: FAD-dependent 5-carboxymethylaminomethyl-2-thiouridine(34) oxidoreductase MnmC [Burkholderiales bacterium]